MPRPPITQKCHRADPDEIALQAMAECVAETHGKTAYEAQLLAELLLERMTQAGVRLCTHIEREMPDATSPGMFFNRITLDPRPHSSRTSPQSILAVAAEHLLRMMRLTIVGKRTR